MTSTHVRTNQEGLEIIGNAEGCMRNPYVCPTGYLTVGIGSRIYEDEPAVRKAGLTDQEIADRWVKNIQEAETCVNNWFHGKEMNDNQFSAMTSMVFNHGCTKLRRNKDGSPTRIYTAARYQNWTEMCNRITDWDEIIGNAEGCMMGGKYRGLTIRKQKEKALCLKPVQ
ncbi:lysin [Salmonella phage SPHG1]|nr:lysin [Salmonella phage SPHG1]